MKKLTPEEKKMNLELYGNEEGTQPVKAESQEQAPSQAATREEATPETAVSPPDLDDMSDKLEPDYMRLKKSDLEAPPTWTVPQGFEVDLQISEQLALPILDKPGPTEWFRVHPNPPVGAMILKPKKGLWLLNKVMAEAIGPAAKRFQLFYVVTSDGTHKFWPVSWPKDDSEPNTWITSALRAIESGKKRWTQVASNMATTQYDIRTTDANLDEPCFAPDPKALLHLLFSQKGIATLDHPVARRIITGK